MIKSGALKWARGRLGYTLDEVAALSVLVPYGCAVSVEELEKWENGEVDEMLNSPTLCQLETLGEIYHCPVGWLFVGVPDGGATSLGSL